jgi:hypothetical protein
MSDENASADFFDFVAIDVDVFCLFTLWYLFILFFRFIYADDSGFFSRLIQ